MPLSEAKGQNSKLFPIPNYLKGIILSLATDTKDGSVAV